MSSDGYLIDISRLLDRISRGRLPTGIDRVCLAYIARWGGRSRAVIHRDNWRRLVSYADSQTLFGWLQDPPKDLARRVNWLIARACIPPWPSQDAKGALSFYLGHSGLDLAGFPAWLKATRQRPVYFVHDLIPLTHAEYCRPEEEQRHAVRMTAMLQSGAGIIGNSQATLDELAHVAQARGLPMPPSVVALLASASLAQAAPQSAPPLAAPYFVVLGTIEPRKNHLLLLNIWRELASRLGDATPHLVLIGQRGWECENVVDMLERCAPLRPFVHEIPACGDAELAAYLHHARALLFPSFVEGYGMPLVEALALGTPVIASDLGVFREVAADVPDYLSPIDALGWIQAIDDYTQQAPEHPRRTAQLQRLARYTPPSWDAHFVQVEALLERLA